MPLTPVRLIVLGAAYFAAAQVALVWSSGRDGIASVWPASGILLAALLVYRGSRPWGIYAACGLASLAANLSAGMPTVQAAGFTFANLIEGWVALRLLRKIDDNPASLVESRALIRFVAAIAAAAVLSAVVAAPFAPDPNLRFLWSWFSTVFLGMLLVGPFLLLVRDRTMADERRGAIAVLPLILLLLLVAAAAATTFMLPQWPLMFVPLIALQPLVVRYGLLGASAGVLTIAIIGSLITAFNAGPVAALTGDHGIRTVFLQGYLFAAWLGALPIAALLSSRDATLRQLAATVELLERAERAARIGHWRYDMVEQSLVWSDEMFRLHGMDAAIQPTFARALVTVEPAHRMRIMRTIVVAVERGVPFQYVTRLTSDAAGVIDVLSHGELERDRTGRVIAVFGTMQDITTQVAQHRDLIEARTAAEQRAMLAQQQADTDPLTGIANRRSAIRIGEAAVASDLDVPLSVLVLDADHFKTINDRFGHAVGDVTLVRIADVARHQLRTGDFIARMGGEEFVLLLPGAAADVASAVAERIRAAIQQDVRRPDGRPVTVSLGIAQRQPDDDFDSLLNRADRALYEAKTGGRNRFALAA